MIVPIRLWRLTIAYIGQPHFPAEQVIAPARWTYRGSRFRYWTELIVGRDLVAIRPIWKANGGSLADRMLQLWRLHVELYLHVDPVLPIQKLVVSQVVLARSSPETLRR
jgi:hypothetical protein